MSDRVNTDAERVSVVTELGGPDASAGTSRDGDPVRLEDVVNLGEFETLARARMQRAEFDYVVGGSWDEVTLRDNVDAFVRRRLRPRVLIDVSRIGPATVLLGTPVAMPVGLAPTALQRFAHHDAELAAARAAATAGVLFCLSTFSSYPLEEVAQAGGGSAQWFQLYVNKDRGLTAEMIARAVAAGYRALVLTVDLPVSGYRERDLRNRLPAPDRLGNLPAREGVPIEFIELIRGFNDQSLTWRDIEGIREAAHPLPLVIKGIMTGEDAALAVEHGAAGVWVSNHGGRQLDRVPASLDVLEEVAQAVGGRAEVYLDGGVRRGTDVLAALALGARAVFLGRPYLYALGAGGEAGVTRALRLLRRELEEAMILLGVRTPAEVTRRHLAE